MEQNVVAHHLTLNNPGKWRMKTETGIEKTSSDESRKELQKVALCGRTAISEDSRGAWLI